jgi:hypothetical protein
MEVRRAGDQASLKNSFGTQFASAMLVNQHCFNFKYMVKGNFRLLIGMLVALMCCGAAFLFASHNSHALIGHQHKVCLQHQEKSHDKCGGNNFISTNNAGFSINYNQTNEDNQYRFQTSELSEAKVVLFTHQLGRANASQIKLNGVYGVGQFFLDMDLISGYVHDYTKNFYVRCPVDGFLLKVERLDSTTNKAVIRYVRKDALSPRDKLGVNIVSGRQWRLSEFHLKGDSLEMVSGKCTQVGGFVPANNSKIYKCPPLQNLKIKSPGVYHLDQLDAFSRNDGGTVAIVWDTKAGGVRFIDIHGSIKDILEAAIKVRDTYQVDPTILIHDAGPMARKIKADANGDLDFALVNKVTGLTGKVGAGYAYLMDQ